jgi:predicted phage terminase large subunit-like protein
MTRDQVIAKKCLQSFSFFTRYFFKERNGKQFVVGEHHKDLFRQAHAIAKGEQHNTIINIAPRYSKTEIMVKNFIAWSLARNPKSRFIHLSYSDQLALDNSEEIKDIITSHEYQQLFPYVQIKKDSKAKNKWYTTEGGGVLARSAAGQVTGFGAGIVGESEIFGGAIIIDDPIKPDDADSETIREKVNHRFDSTIRNRVNSRDTPIIVIMQRLHQEDLSGYIMDNDPDEWSVTSMPVIKEDGQPLWEFKHTLEELNKLRKINPFVFDTQYMQNPTPKEGLMFPKIDMKFYDYGLINWDESFATIGFVDIADQGEDNHCCVIGKIVGDSIYIVDVLFTKEGTDKNVQMTADIINRHEPEFVRVESNFGGTMYNQLLQPKLNSITTLLPVRAKSNKHGRIKNISGFIKQHTLYRKDWENCSEDYKLFFRNLTEYNNKGTVKHDDAPDSMHGLSVMARAFHSDIWSASEIEEVE